jgi:hypothetical protein
MIGISEAYDALRLHFASRYYAAGAVFACLNQENENISRRLSQATFCLTATFYPAGEGLTFLHSFGTALMSHDSTATDAENWPKHLHVQQSLAQAAKLRAMARHISPELLPHIDAAIARWPLTAEERAAFITLSEGEPWSRMTAAEIESKIADQLGKHLFDDVGARRAASWSAFGVTWTVQSSADEDTWLAALEAATALQIVQIEFADVDLLVIPSRAFIYVELKDVDRPQFHQLPDNGSLSWQVAMPRTPSSGPPAGLVALAITVLQQATALPSKEFQNLTRERMERGLPNRVHSVRPIRELLKFALPETIDFTVLSSITKPELHGPLTPIEAPELTWRTGPGPGYSPTKAKKYIQNRYKTTLRSLRFTLPRLLTDTHCRSLTLQLRTDGVLDWQILVVLANIVGQWQIERKLTQATDPGELQRRMTDRLFREERDDDPAFDLSHLTNESIERQLSVLPVVVFGTWRLECHRRTPDFRAMKRLLDERYRHSTDDIPHEDPFQGIGGGRP